MALSATGAPLESAGVEYSPELEELALVDGEVAASTCRSRAEWGADESLRSVNGVESWEPTFFPLQGIIVHHTVSANADPDPAETVRAIYHQHTVLNDWGDIGYNFLVDEAGTVYEGRWSGSTSAPCAGEGDGSDFAHNETGDVVTAGHTGYHNQGTVGVALLGNFASPGELGDPDWIQVDPTPAARDGLVQTLTRLVDRHDIDPLGEFEYANPMCDLPPDQWEWDCSDTGLPYFPGRVRDDISGHRDWRATACPGAALYALLPQVRADVAGAVATASVSGTVVDASGAPVADATVVTDTGEATVTGADGTYGVEAVPVGDRTLEATAPGYAPSRRELSLEWPDATVDFELFPVLSRLAGPNRYATSAAISEQNHAPGVPVVYMAVGTGFPDALSIGPVAGAENAPVLLTETNTIPAPITAELARLAPERIVVVGGPGVISDTVLGQLLSPYVP
jgi:hypothetical protein